MRKQQKLILCLIAPLFIVTAVTTKGQGRCLAIPPGPPCQEYESADAVFIGTATRVVSTQNSTQLAVGPYAASTAYFSIEEIFKGVEGSEVVLDLSYCSLYFAEGERYLVYAKRNSANNKLGVIAGNTRTNQIAYAGADLEYIRSLSSAEPGSRIFGKATRSTFNIRESRYDVEVLKGVTITLEGNSRRQKVVSDSEGKYDFKHLAAGTYRLRALVPANLSYAEQTIKITGHGCVPLDIRAMRKGEITGTVFDASGKPLGQVPISIVSADVSLPQMLVEGCRETCPWTFTFTDEQGRYQFSHLGPGRYFLIINRTAYERALGTEVSRLLPRLFNPGVNDIAEATAIVVRDAQNTPEYDFHLPSPR
jgi:hypothetical protein